MCAGYQRNLKLLIIRNQWALLQQMLQGLCPCCQLTSLLQHKSLTKLRNFETVRMHQLSQWAPKGSKFVFEILDKITAVSQYKLNVEKFKRKLPIETCLIIIRGKLLQHPSPSVHEVRHSILHSKRRKWQLCNVSTGLLINQWSLPTGYRCLVFHLQSLPIRRLHIMPIVQWRVFYFLGKLHTKNQYWFLLKIRHLRYTKLLSFMSVGLLCT